MALAKKAHGRADIRRHCAGCCQTPAYQSYPWFSRCPPGCLLATSIASRFLALLKPSLVGMRSRSGALRGLARCDADQHRHRQGRKDLQNNRRIVACDPVQPGLTPALKSSTFATVYVLAIDGPCGVTRKQPAIVAAHAAGQESPSHTSLPVPC
jgi:hypothetical protein